jgi:hypothetical protein
VAEKKFLVGSLPSATLGKGVAECLRPFAESFRLSAKPEFPVVSGINLQVISFFILLITKKRIK